MWENYLSNLQLLYAAVLSFYDKNCSFFVISPLFTVVDRIQQHWRTRKGEEKPEANASTRGDRGGGRLTGFTGFTGFTKSQARKS